jgi:molybdopterin-guanine dinucleotide biosynthesis protein A
MGVDKSVLVVDGVALARRVANVLAAAGCEPVVCQGGDAEALAAVGLAVAPDSRPGDGPLTAILDALTRFAPADVVVCACDLPSVDRDTVSRLRAAATASPEIDVVAAIDESGPHLLSVWHARAREPLTSLIGQGVRSYRAALERLASLPVEVPESVLVNLNRPEDLP